MNSDPCKNRKDTMKDSVDTSKNAAKTASEKLASKLPKIDVSSQAKANFERASKFVTNSPRIAQFVMGGTSGWFTGFLTSRVGKTVAIPVGGSILILGAANSLGIAHINWDKFGKWTADNASKVKEYTPALKATVMKNGKLQPIFTAAFVGGFLLGFIS